MRGTLGLILGLLAAVSMAISASAAGYPSRLITLVVPYAAGGGLDQLARQLGAKLADRLGQPVVVENRSGGGTVIGANSIAKAVPDGYNIMLGTSTPLALAVTLNKSLPYDPAQDFVPIALVSNAPFMLVVNPDQPIHSVADLIKFAKEKPGELSYGSAGMGTSQHLCFELLKQMSGIDAVHVPHRGDAPLVTNLVAGHVPIAFGEPTSVLPLVQDGKLRALAVSSPTRLPNAPDVPTMAEAGFPSFNLTSWQMIVAPAGTPPEIVSRLHQEIQQVLVLPDIRAEFARTGRISISYPPVEELQRFMRDEIIRWGKMVEQAGVAKSQ